MMEIGFGPTLQPPYGTPRNPWDLSRTPGGSSSGSASGVASFLCPITLRGDMGGSILFRHVLPQCVAPYIVFATANLGYAIVVEASLSFLGVGTPIDIPSWGGMLAISGQKYIELSPWLLVFPSLAISLVVFGFNLFGDAMRDVLDPRLRGT